MSARGKTEQTLHVDRVGSKKPKELAKSIQDADKIEIKPSQIDLNKEINKIGTYEAKINLHAEVQAKIHIEVVKQEEEN